MRRLAVLTAAVLAVSLTACGGKQDNAAQGGSPDECTAGAGRLTIATGNSTGVYYVIGGGLAELISNNTPLRATAAETGASVQNIEQLVSGAYDIAFSLADTASDAVEGTGSFTAKQPVQALTRLYSNYTQVVVRADSGITSVADMKGRTISTGSPKSGTEVIANRLLTAAGLADTDVSAQRLDLDKTVSGMKDGSIDGLFWSGGLPTPALTDLFTSLGDQVRFVDITPLLPAMQEISPVYEQAAIPAATYSTPADVPTIVVPNYLLVKEDFAEGNACAITKLIFDKRPDLEKVHPAVKQILPEQAAETGNVPLHPGSRKALDELG
ncbi:MAG TPA: TAXI family TRAP transporter solute-binding subunit [Pseudonocardiaceae bacterium]